MTTATVAGSQPWYRSLNATQWKTVFASNLGWMFDGYETFSLILVVGVALRDLLAPAQFGQIPAFAGTVIGITLLGWGIGGVIGGVLADYIGRRRTMIFAILAYSITTGLSAFAWDWVSFALLRFLVGIAIGSEWSTGASLTAEVWPDNARGRGAGLMQCGLGIGFFLASFTWLFVSGYGPGAWRIMFIIGVIPALFTFWLRSGIPESQKWEHSNEKRKSAHARKKSGAALNAEDQHLTRFTFADLFADPEVRKITVIVFLMSLTTTVAWWGISTWVPPFIAAAAGKAGLPPQTWASYAGMSYNIGAICGYIGLGFFADSFGRKPVVMIFIMRAMPSGVRSATLPSPASFPRRRIVTSSANAITSRNLCVIIRMVSSPRTDHVAQHAEHFVGLLRRQHRGRLVEDQESALRDRAASGFRISASRRPTAPTPWHRAAP